MNNCNLEMMCTKALIYGKKINTIPNTASFFEVLKEHEKDLYIFASGTNAIFANDAGFDIMNLKDIDSSLNIHSIEEFVTLANYEPFSEAVDTCEALKINVNQVKYTYKYKHLYKLIKDPNTKLIAAILKRKLKFVIYQQNGRTYLLLFHLYTSRKNLDDVIQKYVVNS